MTRVAIALFAAIVTATPAVAVPARWTPLRPHAVQSQLWHSPARFVVAAAGRRSGKTELAKRKIVRRAIEGTQHFPARFFAAAPTHAQAKRLYWSDLKALIPSPLLAGKPSESELVIRLVNGAEIYVLGMDAPERIEGSPWDGGILDEYANMKGRAWGEHVRPALADRNGWCWLVGVPEGRNHYYDRWRFAQADTSGEWAAFTWHSADILDAAEIEAARRDLDPLVFRQEYEGSFVSFEGRAYYGFDETRNAAPLHYDPTRDLIIALDFNVAPGVAAVAQEQPLPRRNPFGGWSHSSAYPTGTGWIGEVWIPRASNTELVCRRLLADWGQHAGLVFVYGDATGGGRGTAALDGSDVELVERFLRTGFPSDGLPGFGDRLRMRFERSNPSERARVNAVNTRLHNSTGEVRMMVDPTRAPHLVRDFEGVLTVEGGSGELLKKPGSDLTHISDAAGYYVASQYPVTPRTASTQEVLL